MLFIAVAGPSGSGKSTISKKIVEHFGNDKCAFISCDNYYKDLSQIPPEQRKNYNYDHPDSVDFDLLIKDILTLKSGKPIDEPIYRFGQQIRLPEVIHINPKPVIIIEGILALHPEALVKLYDAKIYIDADLDICLIRRIQRDILERQSTYNEVVDRYLSNVKPMFGKFIAPCKNKADIVVVNNTMDFTFDTMPVINFLDKKLKQIERHKHNFISEICAKIFARKSESDVVNDLVVRP